MTLEEGSVGGFGAMVLHLLAEGGRWTAARCGCGTLTLPDSYQEHDTPERMYAEAGLDAASIVKAVEGRPALARRGAGGARAPASRVTLAR